jgi:hypothetical protein
MSFTVPLPPRTQLYNRSCSNKHTHLPHANIYTHAVLSDVFITAVPLIKLFAWGGECVFIVCVFITAGPSTKLFAWEGGDIGGHVLRETTSRGLCGLHTDDDEVCPSRTVYYCSTYYKAVRVGGGGGTMTSRGLCGLVCPSRTSERAAGYSLCTFCTFVYFCESVFITAVPITKLFASRVLVRCSEPYFLGVLYYSFLLKTLISRRVARLKKKVSIPLLTWGWVAAVQRRARALDGTPGDGGASRDGGAWRGGVDETGVGRARGPAPHHRQILEPSRLPREHTRGGQGQRLPAGRSASLPPHPCSKLVCV